MNLSPAAKQNHVQDDIHKSPEVYCTEYMGFYLGIGIDSQMENYAKILPFQKHEVIKKNDKCPHILDGFLKETGYVENYKPLKTRSYSQSNNLENKIKIFLRELGYVE